MESCADLIIVSQLDLLDTAGTRRSTSSSDILPTTSSTLYRKPGDVLKTAHVPEEDEQEQEQEDEKDTQHLVASSHETLNDEPALIKQKSLLVKTASIAVISVKSMIETNMGLIYMVFASFAFCITSIAVKAMSVSAERVPTLEIIFVRSCLVYILVTGYMIKRGYADVWGGPRGVRVLLVVRGLIGFLGMTCGWFALSMLTLGDATVLGFLSPMFTAILARFILKEPYEVLDAVTGVLSMVGVIFIARPGFIFGRFMVGTTPDELMAGGDFGSETAAAADGGFVNGTETLSRLLWARGAEVVEEDDDGSRALGVLLGLAGAVFGALVYIIVRNLAGRATPLHILSVFSLSSIPLSLLFSLFLPSTTPWLIPQDPLTYMYLTLIACSALAGQLFLCKSLEREAAGKASSMNYVQVLVAFVAEWVVWGVQPNGWSVVGSLIIGSCVVLIAVVKIRKLRAAKA
ncbi:hypothetical protein DFS34DRAFT_423753 [Phlyctochytrium arcticum]|nr:hypothetical protein DFS34DRAFT_423753 [Phlyctochytrium arcticum]